ncbi:class A beta-lactamase [Acidisoma sp.]|uniref:class A beta-lactamase n=1 Tax=Acidisoma sp. TaxID=1872115 RepID=UPI003AFF7539
MTLALTRRSFAAAASGAAFCGALPARAQNGATPQAAQSDPGLARAHAAIGNLEARHGGRLGVVAVDTGSGRRIGYRGDERFAMCSTHKFLTAAAVLATVDEGKMTLDQRVPYTRADLLDYAPVARQNAGAGFMTVAALCAAAMEWSDNTAENLLLKLIGGPPGWTRYARAIGDTTSRLDRFEPALNTAVPGDPRDTTTPEAMVRDLHVVLLGNALTKSSRGRLETWMLDGRITASLLRAGVPPHWRVADKSGSGENGTRNDIGIILPPKAAPVLAAIYYTRSTETLASRENVLADTGRIIARTFS